MNLRIIFRMCPRAIRASGHFRLTHVFNRNVARKKVDWSPLEVQWLEVQWKEVSSGPLSSEVDVVVELMGGLKPKRETGLISDGDRESYTSGKCL